MPIFESDSISKVALHRVGNKVTDEGYMLSNSLLNLNDNLRDLLIKYFISPFKVEEYYHLYDENGVELNQVYQAVQHIFADPESLFEESKRLATLLYDACLHPNIKGGDLFVVLFENCQLNGETMNAIGLFKSENKDRFIKVLHDEEEWSREEGNMGASTNFKLEIDSGININKLDKGALIFNSEADEGYIVSAVDATNRGQDAAYWKDEFLHLQQREDEYYSTHSELVAYKEFVTKEMPQQFEGVEKADCADLLNRSVNYFKENRSFDLQNFSEEVIQQPEVIESFKQFREDYQKDNEVTLHDQFDISEEVVKKQARNFKSVIKLDKNFHIYVHGNSSLIEKGSDERGTFYKVYYTEES